MEEILRVAIVDDHTPYRERVAEMLRAAHNIVVVGLGTCADDALHIAKHHRPHLILLDLSMPGGGIEAARRLSLAYPKVAGVILTSSNDDSACAAARAAGARGYLLKGLSGCDLVAIIHSICGTPSCALNDQSLDPTFPLRNSDFWQTY